MVFLDLKENELHLAWPEKIRSHQIPCLHITSRKERTPNPRGKTRRNWPLLLTNSQSKLWTRPLLLTNSKTKLSTRFKKKKKLNSRRKYFGSDLCESVSNKGQFCRFCQSYLAARTRAQCKYRPADWRWLVRRWVQRAQQHSLPTDEWPIQVSKHTQKLRWDSSTSTCILVTVCHSCKTS
jgi:hypothetical protein